jgi:ribosomal protein L25 (general stress protein Ctc)
MPQNAVTGRQGLVNGYNNADQIGVLLGAVRLANNSNEFRWQGRVVVIKTGSSVVVTRATLGRVAAVIYGEETDNGWILYELDPATFEQLSVQSRSRIHNENYRLVRRTQIRDHGRSIVVAE